MIPAQAPRVLVVGSNRFYDSMEAHVLDALAHMGCATEFVAMRPVTDRLGRSLGQLASRAASIALREPERLAERRLLRTGSAFSPSLVLVILGSQVSPKTVERLRARTQTPVVCWCQDAMTNLGRQYLLGARYDAVFLKDRYLRDLFARMVKSTEFHYLPEACNPRVHRSLELTAEDRRRFGCDVMIAGTLYYYRQEILRQLDEFDLKVWGGTFGWMVNRMHERFMGREVYGDDKVRAARAARIALNPLHFAEVDSLNCRTFELAGCGAFQLVSAKPVLAEHFTPCKELDCFGSTDELIEKIRHYLAHPSEAQRIARQGQERAHREHTYEHRLDVILRTALRRSVVLHA